MRWAIQTNLGSRSDAEALAAVCRAQGHAVAPIVRPPFSDAAPELDTDEATVFYGSSSLIDSVVRDGRWRPGAWALDDDYASWIERYGAHMLNVDARFLSLEELAADAELANSEALRFCRPSADSKLIAGQVDSGAALVAWARRVLALEDASMDPDTKLMLAEPVGLSDEWRTFVVDGRVVAGSHYRSYQRLEVSPDLPGEVVAFTEALLARGSPAPVVVVDIARSGSGLYVVEFNGFNSSGFYAAELSAIVAAVSERA
ncbi:hypothetical protein PPSIR1_18837 [Plesiocystis pacifica SIR-1]|uniref:ATP-grasp domain-containing protein n=1 Tax=Plesiocystis pacifica SIR-1 TaxID=391625 RepID=A6GBI3_9BACT|nr:ATP-grasp domain-containing protein [Plesiocystis pacifica]EDM76787.1 hypothetical protein PPSIR1_18837 [Plesiocystis pacifica SIR-1]